MHRSTRKGHSGITTVAALIILMVIGLVMTIGTVVTIHLQHKAMVSVRMVLESSENEWLPELNYAVLEDEGTGHGSR